MRAGDSRSEQAHRGAFATTHWSVVLAAGDKDTSESAEALEQLCRTYWYPLYAHVRRRGYSAEGAQDLTQEFFTRFLAGQYLSQADPHRGRFRSYLLGALNHFLSDAWDYAHRQKRQGSVRLEPLDLSTAEIRYLQENSDPSNSDGLYDRRWATTLLGQVLRQLRREYEAMDKIRLFERLRAFLPGAEPPASYEEAARELELSEGATRVAVHRLRKRYGELFQQAVADTVASPEEVRDEMRHLLKALTI